MKRSSLLVRFSDTLDHKDFKKRARCKSRNTELVRFSNDYTNVRKNCLTIGYLVLTKAARPNFDCCKANLAVNPGLNIDDFPRLHLPLRPCPCPLPLTGSPCCCQSCTLRWRGCWLSARSWAIWLLK